MWVIFLLSAIAFAIVALIVLWIGNKVFISIKRQNINFEKELKETDNEEK